MTEVGGGYDPPFLDDILLKRGSLGKYEERIETESPETFWNWDRAAGNLTLEGGEWRVHYSSPWPLCFYHERRFVFGVRIGEQPIYVDFESPDAVWARAGERVVVERGDYPRFQLPSRVKLSSTPKRGSRPNTYTLGNGYSLACSREATPFEYGMTCPEGAWWMIGPTEEEEALSRRVLAVKLYDGPYRFQSRGTDIRISDPIPLSEASEYVIYSYDRDEFQGLFRQSFVGVAPQKKAFTLQGTELSDRIVSKEGELELVEGQLAGAGSVIYELPLNATKLLDIYTRGSEVETLIRPDDEEWVRFEDYDGRAVTTLEVKISVYNSLASVRVEWESLKHWEPVGRPYIDIIRPEEREDNTNENKVKITGTEGEGLGQATSLYTGSYTVSADVRCLAGEAAIDIGGLEIVTWHPLDKTIRAHGDLIAGAGEYEIILTGNGDFSYEIDRFMIAEAGDWDWLDEDMQWQIETEGGIYDASESINRPDMPVSFGEASRFRLRVKAPEDIGKREKVAISSVGIDTYRTGDNQVVRYVKWRGRGESRIHYPENVRREPVPGSYITARGSGAILWEQSENTAPDDVKLTLDGSLLSFSEEQIHRPVTLSNRLWRVELLDESAEVYYQEDLVAVLSGLGIPFTVLQDNPEDIQVDCSTGFVQLRRGLGPRFQGWEAERYTRAAIMEIEGSIMAFGATEDEARENLPFYSVTVGR